MDTIQRLAFLEIQIQQRELSKAVDIISNRSSKIASVGLTPEILHAFGDVFLLRSNTHIAFGGILKQLSKLVKLFKRAPELLERLKEFLGELTYSNIKKWVQEGFKDAKKYVLNAIKEWPLALFFFPKSKLPSITELMHKILDGTKIGSLLSKIKPAVIKIDSFLNKHPIIRKLSRPVLAAIFIWIWFNVAEISWDMDNLIKGFTGQISFSELLSSLPESGIGLLFASLGVGYHFMGPVLIARLIWLVASNYITYQPDKGFLIHWDKMGKLSDTKESRILEWSIT